MNQTSWSIEILAFFSAIIAVSLFLDFYCHKHTKTISITNSICWSIFWIILALLFYTFIWWKFSEEWANLYLVGYVLEKCLAFDNLIIFMAIFSSFGVTPLLQRKILFWGIFGAIIFRAIFISIGINLLFISSWVELVLAIFIVWSAIKMLQNKKSLPPCKDKDFSKHWSIKLIEKFLPIYPRFYDNKFFVTGNELLTNKIPDFIASKGKIYVTPAFLCLIVIEISDVAFAFDSVPAIIAITKQPILVYTAVIFAILGLRSLYFALEILTKKLVYLEKSVIVLLFFIAAKMFVQFFNHTIYDTKIYISAQYSLIIVFTILALGIVLSFIKNSTHP